MLETIVADDLWPLPTYREIAVPQVTDCEPIAVKRGHESGPVFRDALATRLSNRKMSALGGVAERSIAPVLKGNTRILKKLH